MTRREPAVVVVAYGAPDLLDDALRCLGDGHDVVVVDNAASPLCADIVSRHAAVYLRSPRNVGFAVAVNVGSAAVGPGRDILLLNPDAQIHWPAVLALQAGLHESGHRRAAVAPRLFRPDGSPEPTTWPFPTPLLNWRGAIGMVGSPDPRAIFLSGAVLLLSGEALSDVGPFDERFFLYAEEADWQQRAVRKRWTVRCIPDVMALHHGAATSGDGEVRDLLFHAAAERYVRKWFGGWGWQVFRVGATLSALRRVLWPGMLDAGTRRAQLRVARLYVKGPVGCLPTWANS